MKALTICQPFAELIARGEKRVENRKWKTWYRGPLAIHAGRSRAWLGNGAQLEGVHFGAIIAVADLVEVLPLSDVLSGRWTHRLDIDRFHWLPDSDCVEGPWCWVLDNVRRLSPAIPYKGALGLWDFPDALFGAESGVAK